MAPGSLGKSTLRERRRRGKGARKVPSLVQLCVEKLASNIEEASLETLECLKPSSLLYRVYEVYASNRRETIKYWRIFSRLLVSDLERVPTLLYWFNRSITSESAVYDLPRYVQLTTSSTVDFIVHLTIHKVWMYSTSDLMALADMPNLAILELSDLSDLSRGAAEENETVTTPTSPLDDRLVRAWSRYSNPFPNLRILLLAPVHASITLLTLRYASSFPSLVYCSLWSLSIPPDESEVRATAMDRGWRFDPTLDPWSDLRGTQSEPVPCRGNRRERAKAKSMAAQELLDFHQDPRTGVFLSHTTAAQPITVGPELQGTTTYEDKARIATGWNLYSALGEQIGNADLVAQGVPLRHRATHFTPIINRSDQSSSPDTPLRTQKVVPPKPMLNLSLGHPAVSYVVRNHFREVPVYTFVRDYSPAMARQSDATGSGEAKSTEKAHSPHGSSKRKNHGEGAKFKPRRRLDLNEFLGGG